MSAIYGIIGYPLTHSFSPAYFTKKFAEQHIDANYRSFPLHTIDEFPSLLQLHPGIRGLNVTIPYKESIIPYLDSLDNIANAVGAVNCIDIDNGTTKGFNTDVTGFEKSLVPLLKKHHQHALILGTGGASKAVAYVLNNLHIHHKKVSRQDDTALRYEAITPELLEQYTLIINTTPLGMYPYVDDYPLLPYKAISERHLLYDLIYNPAETKFLSLGKERGASVKNGFEMLEIQAEESWRIWNSANE